MQVINGTLEFWTKCFLWQCHCVLVFNETQELSFSGQSHFETHPRNCKNSLRITAEFDIIQNHWLWESSVVKILLNYVASIIRMQPPVSKQRFAQQLVRRRATAGRAPRSSRNACECPTESQTSNSTTNAPEAEVCRTRGSVVGESYGTKRWNSLRRKHPSFGRDTEQRGNSQNWSPTKT